MKRILGLDPAGSFGWSLIDEENYIDGGVVLFKPPTKSQILKKGLAKGKKWADALEWIQTLPDLEPDMVFIEDVKRHISTMAGHSYGFYRYSVEAIFSQRGIPVYPIIVKEWKKVAIGNGAADKIQLAEGMNKIYPEVVFKSDDHSDALGIAHAGLKIFKSDGLQLLLDKQGGKKKK